MNTPTKHGRIAVISTPKFREMSRPALEAFVYRRMFSLCNSFAVLTTGRTYECFQEIIGAPLDDQKRLLIREGTQFPLTSEDSIKHWRDTIFDALEVTAESFPGMIHVAYELVEGRLDAVLHFTDWEDKSAKPDSAVLSREANVHNVPIATDLNTTTAYLETWNSLIAKESPVFRKREGPKDPPLVGLEKGDKVLAMIAHDNSKLDMCCFAIENAAHIFKRYDYILATGTTGTWIRKFMEAAGRSPDDIRRIRCCYSGPMGGDLQIAFAVVQELCSTVIFLQDPSVNHPHDSDIRLFEQAVLSGVEVKLATNIESARLLIGV